jgi:hypothetical protein
MSRAIVYRISAMAHLYHCRRSALITLGAWALLSIFATATLPLDAQAPPQPAAPQAPPSPYNVPKGPSPIERLGPNTVRVGNITVDTAKKELSVRGVVNDVTALEFIAVTKGGFKAYESVLELDTNAINFNLALILMGLDAKKAVMPKHPGDPALPSGDLVDIFVEWKDESGLRRVRAEELVYNATAKQTLSNGPWVYTGSVFVEHNNAYMADLEGSLIGFIHSMAPIIESPRPFKAGDYYGHQINPKLNLKAGTEVTMTVRAVPATGK